MQLAAVPPQFVSHSLPNSCTLPVVEEPSPIKLEQVHLQIARKEEEELCEEAANYWRLPLCADSNLELFAVDGSDSGLD